MNLKYIRVASDLHLEAYSGRAPETLMIDFLPKDEHDAESLLVLAGDISSQPEQLLGFLTACQKQFKHVLFIPGNHEYYRHNYDEWNESMDAAIKKNLPELIYDLTGVGEHKFDNVRLLFCTLWGDGGAKESDNFWVDQGLNDFRLIRKGQERFKVGDMIKIHGTQKSILRQKLNEKFDGKTVVVTHHLPSRRLVSARFIPREGGDGINGGFVGDCDNILAYDNAPDIWIHGHTHDTGDGVMWKTRIVCNPAGYRGEYATQFNSFMQKSELNPDVYAKPVAVPKVLKL